MIFLTYLLLEVVKIMSEDINRLNMFNIEELQKMNKNELIKVIGNYISDQEIWMNQVKGLEKQIDDKNEEIKQLIEYCGMFENGEIGSPITTDKIFALEKEKIELQKQVDDLTVKVKSFEMTDLCKQAYIDQLKEENKELVSAKVFELETKNTELQKQVDELKANQVIECHGMLKGCDIVKQAVKDTAKEILQKIMNIIKKSDGFLAEEVIRIIAKQNGVEVE